MSKEKRREKAPQQVDYTHCVNANVQELICGLTPNKPECRIPQLGSREKLRSKLELQLFCG